MLTWWFVLRKCIPPSATTTALVDSIIIGLWAIHPSSAPVYLHRVLLWAVARRRRHLSKGSTTEWMALGGISKRKLKQIHQEKYDHLNLTQSSLLEALLSRRKEFQALARDEGMGPGKNWIVVVTEKDFSNKKEWRRAFIHWQLVQKRRGVVPEILSSSSYTSIIG